MITYFDASSLVKYFIEEDGSSEIRQRMASSVPIASRLSQIEIASAICRRCREGHITEENRAQSLTHLTEVLGELYIVELTPAIAERAQRLLQRFALRAGDAIQLASFLVIREGTGLPVTFSAFDQRLIEAAENATADLDSPTPPTT